MLGHIRKVRVGDHCDLFDVLLMVPHEAEVCDHCPETVPPRECGGADNDASKVAICLALRVNGKLDKSFFAERGLRSHQQDGMLGSRSYSIMACS